MVRMDDDQDDDDDDDALGPNDDVGMIVVDVRMYSPFLVQYLQVGHG